MPATPKAIDPVAVTTAQRQKLTPNNEKRMRQLLDAICDPTRVKIVRALRDAPLAASDIARVIGRDRAATCQHLRVLRERGAVIGRRTGNVIRYALTDDMPGSVIEEACAAFDQLQPKTASAAS
jgi:DNA-binding transcriptional ArsR family regulator